MSDTQASIEALEGLEFQFSKLSDKDWTATFQIIRAALQSKSVDVEGLKKTVNADLTIHTLKDYTDIAWNDCIDHLAVNGYLNTQPQSPVTKEEAREAFDDFDNQIAQQNTELWNDTIETIRKCLQAAG